MSALSRLVLTTTPNHSRVDTVMAIAIQITAPCTLCRIRPSGLAAGPSDLVTPWPGKPLDRLQATSEMQQQILPLLTGMLGLIIGRMLVSQGTSPP